MSCVFVRLPASMYKKANVYRMANDTIVKFIELYRSCECLWNVSSEDYGSRLSRNAAYGTISRKMRIPGFGPREVARKIKNLRSAYQQEVKRIETTEQNHGTATGTVHRPRAVWFDLLDEFLRNSEKPGQSDRQSDNQQSEAASKVLSNDEREKNVTNSPRNLSPYESSSSEIESDRSSRKRRPCVADAFRRVVGEERRKRRKGEEDAIEVEEYDSFGKYVAASLSRMPFEYAVSAETEIHSVIIKYKVYAMRKIVYPTTTTTTAVAGAAAASRTRARTSTLTSSRTTRRSPSTYLPCSNFSSTLRQRIEETRPSSVDSIGNASD